MLAHAALGRAFNLPVVITTSSDSGPNGLLLKEIRDMYPNVNIVHRQGEVNAWDNLAFQQAVYATGKRQLIIGGIVTEVCQLLMTYSNIRGIMSN
jgi:nicotinamidase-related amidase